MTKECIYMREYCFYVYIMTSRKGTLYTGITNNIYRRVVEHKEKVGSLFTAKYCCNKLIYFEEFKYVDDAISREKQLKNWRREKKEKLIQERNPSWVDLSKDWL